MSPSDSSRSPGRVERLLGEGPRNNHCGPRTRRLFTQIAGSVYNSALDSIHRETFDAENPWLESTRVSAQSMAA